MRRELLISIIFIPTLDFPHCNLSHVHVRNLHPGCIFGHVNGVLSICTRVQIGCKFSPTLEAVQSCFYENQNQTVYYG